MANNVALLRSGFKYGLTHYFRAFKSLWPYLLALHTAELAFYQIVTHVQTQIMEKMGEDFTVLVLLFSGQLLFTLVWSALYLGVIGRGLIALEPEAKASLRANQLSHSLSQTLIETIRAWAKVIRWSLLFLGPGLLVYVRCFWVPLVACFSPAYDRGDTDALELSEHLTRGRWWFVFFLATVSLLAPDLLGDMVQGSDDRILSNPVGVLSASLIASLLNFFCFLVVFKVFASLYQAFFPNKDASPSEYPVS